MAVEHRDRVVKAHTGGREIGSEDGTGALRAACSRRSSASASSRKDADVLVIARRNTELKMPPGGVVEGDRYRPQGPSAQRARRNGIRVTYSTVHKAKGTEADYLILLDGGPPKAGQAAEARALERALRMFRGEDTSKEEERRIWYVALTRAKRKAYVIVVGRHQQP